MEEDIPAVDRLEEESVISGVHPAHVPVHHHHPHHHHPHQHHIHLIPHSSTFSPVSGGSPSHGPRLGRIESSHRGDLELPPLSFGEGGDMSTAGSAKSFNSHLMTSLPRVVALEDMVMGMVGAGHHHRHRRHQPSSPFAAMGHNRDTQEERTKSLRHRLQLRVIAHAYSLSFGE